MDLAGRERAVKLTISGLFQFSYARFPFGRYRFKTIGIVFDNILLVFVHVGRGIRFRHGSKRIFVA